MPTAFKSYEVQARLLAATVAAHPGVKWDYKEIAKFFGESTPDGIQFQFRAIKKDAETLRAAVSNNEDPVKAFGKKSAGSAPATPRKRGRKAADATPSTNARASNKRSVPQPDHKEAGADDLANLPLAETGTASKKTKTAANASALAAMGPARTSESPAFAPTPEDSDLSTTPTPSATKHAASFPAPDPYKGMEFEDFLTMNTASQGPELEDEFTSLNGDYAAMEGEI
ncbi:hypothetical protein VTK73DRAFT_232 [Phialemonium thermophilum]|uniref:Uncharacterized protein n=1 Tax=Phialemonium thermophilum TaxID=223376 RepID=A0ABR3XGG6_9PEZI